MKEKMVADVVNELSARVKSAVDVIEARNEAKRANVDADAANVQADAAEVSDQSKNAS